MNAVSPTSTDLREQLRELTERTRSPLARYAHVVFLPVAAGMGALMLVAAVLLRVCAVRRHRALQARRDALLAAPRVSD